MAEDAERVAAYERDLATAAPGARVLEIGPGPLAVLTERAVPLPPRLEIASFGAGVTSRCALYISYIRGKDGRGGSRFSALSHTSRKRFVL